MVLTTCDPKTTDVVESVTAEVAPETVPVPDRETDAFGPAELEIVKVSFRSPGAVGEKVTLAVQLAPGSNCEGQLLTVEKFALLVYTLRVVVWSPKLLIVTVWAVLEVPTFWLPNVKLLWEGSTKASLYPVPVIEITVVAVLLAFEFTTTVPLLVLGAFGLKFRVNVQ